MRRMDKRRGMSTWTSGYIPPNSYTKNSNTRFKFPKIKGITIRNIDKFKRDLLTLFGSIFMLIFFILAIYLFLEGNYVAMVIVGMLSLASYYVYLSGMTEEEYKSYKRKQDIEREIKIRADMEVKAFSEALYRDSLKNRSMYDTLRKNLGDKK